MLENLHVDSSDQYAYLDIEMSPLVYNEAYFKKYTGYAESAMGHSISEFRCDLARRYGNSVIDIGIGCGHFLETCISAGMRVLGYDVNPAGELWLRSRSLYHDPYTRGWPDGVEVLTLWDVLEHIACPDDLLTLVPAGAVVCLTIPVYSGDWCNLAEWKHYRPQEHVWYWTHQGIIDFMECRDFELVDVSNREVELGREDVGSYCFRRR